MSAASPTSPIIDGDDLIACDTGPGNALLDDFLRLRTGQPLDTDGRMAQAGAVGRACHRALCWRIHSLPRRRRNRSTATISAAGSATTFDNRSVEDGAATLTALTAASVARVVPLLPRAPKTWIVCRRRRAQSDADAHAAERLAPARVETADAAGWSVDSLEAQAFAYLAVRSLRGLPISLPTTTGVPRPLCGGVLAKP